MPPKGNTKKNPAKKAADKANRELVPRPHSYTPPRDPPTMVSNPIRSVSIDLFLAVISTANLTVAQVRTQLTDQVGLPAARMYFQVKDIAAWVTTGSTTGPVTQSVSLKLSEPVYGIESRDDPSPMENARVGIRYPKSVIQTYAPGVAGTVQLATITCQPTLVSSIGITLRVACDYWGSAV